jgi:hypothetical protein
MPSNQEIATGSNSLRSSQRRGLWITKLERQWERPSINDANAPNAQFPRVQPSSTTMTMKIWLTSMSLEKRVDKHEAGPGRTVDMRHIVLMLFLIFDICIHQLFLAYYK